MALQLILGSSGSGKSSYIYQQVIEASEKNPNTVFFIVVPEQFTMQTQRELVMRQKQHGIMNIDVVSFQRLAYRVFDELGIKDIKVLEETGKNFVLRKIAEEKKEQLLILKGSMKKTGYINEVKSVISELAQYRIGTDLLEEFLADESQPVLLRYRLRDIQTMYRGFLDYLEGSYVTAEEILEVLADKAKDSEILKNSVIVLDCFTGFTPIQYYLLEQLMRCSRDMYVTVTLDEREDPFLSFGMQELFYMSKKTIETLGKITRRIGLEMKDPIWISHNKHSRFREAPQLLWLERNLFRSKKKICGEAVTDISMYSLKTPRHELMFTAEEIHRLIREEGYRYKDIAVVCGDVNLYGNYIQEIFEDYNIPVFLDKKNSITFHPMTEMIRNMLMTIEQNFSYESIFAYLRGGFGRLHTEQIDLLENYVLANRIRGYKTWQDKWIRIKGVDTVEELEQVNEARKMVADQFAAVAPVLRSKKTTVLEKTVALYEFIIDLDLQTRLERKRQQLEASGDYALAKEYAQIYKIVMELLDKLTNLLAEEKMSIKEYREILEAGFEAAAVGIIPPGYDQVVLGDIERTRLSHIKTLFFIGVNDGLIPKVKEKGGLISQQERELLARNDIELAPTVREKTFIQRFYLYLNLTKPSKHLYITWFRMNNEGKETRKSYLVGILQKMFPKIQVQQIEETKQIVTPKSSRRTFTEDLHKAKKGDVSPTFKALYHWYMKHEAWAEKTGALLDAAFRTYQMPPMDKEITRALYGEVLENSVTRLERFSSCAFSHFMTYGIGLKERELGEFAPVDMGNMFHEALERYSVRMEEDGYHWFDVPKEIQEKMAEAAVEETVEAAAGSMVYDNARTEYTIERIKRILKRTIDTIGSQIAQSNFTPEGYEVSFSYAKELQSVNFTLSEEEKMRLRGRIDRIDVKQEANQVYVKVIDYKSGNTRFQLVSLYHGLQLQLVVYLNAAVEILKQKYPDKEVKPVGMFYYHIDDPVIDIKGKTAEEEIKGKILEQLKLNGVGIDGADASVEKKSQKADAEELKLLSDYVNHKIRAIGKSIYRGDIEASPYALKEKTGCDYCPYHAICGFDEKLPGYGYRRLSDIKDEDRILAKMKQEV